MSDRVYAATDDLPSRIPMTPKPPIDPRLRDEAFDLVIRIQNDPMNPAPIETARRWRERSDAHRAAWDHAASLHNLTGAALRASAAPPPAPGLSRRAVLAGGAGALAASVGGAFVLPDVVRRFGADVATSTAELRRVGLPDGGVATLGPDSAIRFVFDDRIRRVEMLAGMAFFEPAASKEWPFEARAGDVLASTAAGAFDLSDDAGVLALSVAHGAVAIGTAAGGGGPPLSAGEWITLSEDGQAIERGRRDAVEVAAWRSGTIVAERETMASVATRIARWQPGRTLVDPALGALRVSGVFNLAKPLSALQAVARLHGGHVHEITPWLTVVSRL